MPKKQIIIPKEKKIKIYYNPEIADIPFPELHSYQQLAEKPESLKDVNSAEGSKLTGIEEGATNFNLGDHDSDELSEGSLHKYLLDLAVTELKIASGAVSNAKIKVNAIHGDVIKAGAITETKVANDAIKSPKIYAGAVVGAKIAAGAVIAEKIASSAVTADKIQADAVTAAKINVSQLSAISANIGSVTAGTITGVVLRTAASGRRVYINSDNHIRVYDASRLRIRIRDSNIDFWDTISHYCGKLYAYNGFMEVTGDFNLKKSLTIYGQTMAFSNITAAAKIILNLENQPTLGDSSGHADLIPTRNNWNYLGYTNRKWNKIWRTNESGCNLPTTNSATDIIKKIKKPIVLAKGDYGKRHYFVEKDFPKEMKCYEDTRKNKGPMEIEYSRTVGVLVQVVREMVEREDETKNQLEQINNNFGKLKNEMATIKGRS